MTDRKKGTADEKGKGIIWDGRSDGSELSEEHVGNEEGREGGLTDVGHFLRMEMSLLFTALPTGVKKTHKNLTEF